MKKTFPLSLFAGSGMVAVFTWAAMTAMTSCTKTSSTPDHTRTIHLPDGGPAVINANNQLAFDFLQATLQQDQANNNKLISPLSIFLALSMVYNGAGNATRDSIAQTLKIAGLDINTLNTVCRSLIDQLPKEDNKVSFSIANSIWYRENSYQPISSFPDVTRNYYDATVQALDFNNPQAVNTINSWAAKKTNNKVTKVIESISPDDLMYLMDAIYFNGSWQYAFKASDTRDDIFHLQDGGTKTVPFMNREVRINSVADTSFTLLELPYGGGKSYSMYIALPKDQQQPIGTFASHINKDILQQAIGKMDSVYVSLEIPKWEYAYSIDDMRPELSTLGMDIAFGDRADFSKIYDPAQTRVHISKAVHRTYIKVNEAGAEAAAVTAVGMSVTDVPLIPILKIDHPFLYAIIEKQTGAMLFVGVVNDPSAN